MEPESSAGANALNHRAISPTPEDNILLNYTHLAVTLNILRLFNKNMSEAVMKETG